MRIKIVFFLLAASGLLFGDNSELFKQKLEQKTKDIKIELPSNSSSNYKIEELQRAKVKSGDINITINTKETDMSDMKKLIESEEFKKELSKTETAIINDDDMQYKKLSKTIKEYDLAEKKKLNVQKNDKPVKRFLEGEVITIFISSSMDKELIKNYFRAFKNANSDVEFVLNGLLPNTGTKIMPTINYIKDLLKDEHSFSVVIDPRRFKEYDIDRVPTVLYKNENDVYLYTGAVSPKEALREIYYKNSAKNKPLKKLIENM